MCRGPQRAPYRTQARQTYRFHRRMLRSDCSWLRWGLCSLHKQSDFKPTPDTTQRQGEDAGLSHT